MTDRLDAVTNRPPDSNPADDFATLLHALTVGRRYAVARYVFLIGAGVASWFAPSVVLRERTTSTTAIICSVLWISCGLTCLISAIRDRRNGEYLGIPGLVLGLVVFAGALFWQAFTRDLVTLPYALFIGSLCASLGKRQAELSALRKADSTIGRPRR